MQLNIEYSIRRNDLSAVKYLCRYTEQCKVECKDE